MSIVNPSVFDPTLTPEQVYNKVNTLPVSYWLFSQNTNYFGRLYGVLTGERNEQDWTDFTINHCLRDALWATLASVTDEAENFIGYNVSTRYHTRQVDEWYPSRVHRVMPGIESVGIAPQWSDLEGYEQIEVSPYVITDALVNAGTPPTIELESDVVDNPHNVIVRRRSDLGTYSINQTIRPTKNGTAWVLTFDNNTIPWQVTDEVDVQHVRYTFVDIEPPECDGIVYPVYPGTNQIIPQAKPKEVLDDGLHRYWFYLYTLVDSAFYNNQINFVEGEYYKLLPYISFKCFEEVTATGLLIRTCKDTECFDCCEDTRYQMSARIVDASLGLIEFSCDGELVLNEDTEEYELNESNCGCFEYDSDSRYSLTFYYKTNPRYLSERLQGAISQVERAILFRVAADLPVIDCGCFIDDREKRGFIFRQQETFGNVSVSSFTGVTTTQFDYGDLRGQKAYADIISKVPKFKFVLL